MDKKEKRQTTIHKIKALHRKLNIE